MRSLKLVLAGSALATRLLLPSDAAADPQFFLEEMSCSGIGAVGEGLPAGAPLELTLIDKDNGSVLATQALTASAKGGFQARFKANLNEVLGIRLVVATKAGRRVGFTEHQMRAGHAMCSLPAGGGLPYTGTPERTPVVLGLGAGLLGAGAGLVVLFASRGRRVRAS